MLRDAFLVFDQFLVGTDTYTTSDAYATWLGQFDQIGVQVVMANGSGEGSVEVSFEHSADGQNWVTRNGGVDAPINEGAALGYAYTDSTPSLPLVRLNISLSSESSVSGNVRVYLVLRDTAE